MQARLDRGAAKLLTRTGLDWNHKYPPIAGAVSALGARYAYDKMPLDVPPPRGSRFGSPLVLAECIGSGPS
jgi:hypothetical protein